MDVEENEANAATKDAKAPSAVEQQPSVAKKRCRVCGLPENFPQADIDESGLCAFCRKATEGSSKAIQYKGMKALKKKVRKTLGEYPYEREYDCLLGCSGGRDSTYLMYWIKEVLGLNVLAITMTHDYLPEQTRKNVEIVSGKLGVHVKYMENEDLDKYSRICVRAWAKKPVAPTLISFCSGCRVGLRQTLPAYAKEHHIPILFMGNTPFEKAEYRRSIIALDPEHPTRKSQALGYSRLMLENPAFLKSLPCMNAQRKDFRTNGKYNTKGRWPVVISPFFKYIEWKEDEVIPTLTSLGWKYDESLNSTWRSDCYVNLLRQYYYKRFLGYNDLNVYYATLLRQGKITMEEAEARIAKEGDYSEDMIRKILKDYYDLDYDEIEKKIAEVK